MVSYEEQVVLVDADDRPVGIGGKQSVHVDGALHRAFSIFVFNRAGELLLQRRAGSKYHSAGLWTNTCCGHPRPSESLEAAAARRLQEEMGFACELERAFQFRYRAQLDNGLIEHEIDHVFLGRSDAEPRPNPEEVSDYSWRSPAHLSDDLARHPERYSYWLRHCFARVRDHLQQDARH